VHQTIDPGSRSGMNASSVNGTLDGVSDIGWDHPNVPYAIIVSLGAGLATGIGGALVFIPDLMRQIPQATVLAVSLALSAGVMLYVSFTEIFAKSLGAISEVQGFSEGGASALTTVCFFAGMLFCVLLEVVVHKLSAKSGLKHASCSTPEDAHHVYAVSSTSSAEEGAAGKSPPPSPPDVAPPDVAVEIVGESASSSKSGAKAEELLGNVAEAASLSRMGMMTACAIAIHNFPEGLATFMATIGDTQLGASLGVAIAVHNIPEGLCVAMPIYYATGSKWKGFAWSLLSGVTEPIGGLLGFAVLQPVFTQVGEEHQHQQPRKHQHARRARAARTHTHTCTHARARTRLANPMRIYCPRS
jgi:ZIP family zinc transporter